jgi:hypothetical protein
MFAGQLGGDVSPSEGDVSRHSARLAIGRWGNKETLPLHLPLNETTDSVSAKPSGFMRDSDSLV